MLDKKGKLFGKISVIDLGIIILLIVFALGVYLKFGVLEQTNTSTTNEKITFTLKIPAVRMLYFDQLKVGDAMYESTDNTRIGEITDVYYEDAEVTYVDLDGQSVNGPAEGRYDIYVTVEGEGAISGGRYLMNRTYEIGVGSIRNYMTKYVAFHGQVKEIYTDGA